MNIQDANKRHLDTNFTEWRKSPLSNPPDNQCVEVSFSSNAVGLRDSRNPDGHVLVFDFGEWEAFLGGAAAGSFNLPKNQ
ncbi:MULTISPECIES: DUF397 domain-containing protein [Pseudonocardiaceae]|uniref:DUF397 domain-containing protein n=1 Tax=Amycolatopsis rubida TaxID=112413 RepID=A0A1I5WJV4_9PSEU|nr:DUF397 domain-containing protein [Amycolatopsis rubida]SFQ19950.1 protein of unknown function [Amycolatopsis rubida]